MNKGKQNKKAINNKIGNKKKKHVKFKRVKKVQFKGEKKILIKKSENSQILKKTHKKRKFSTAYKKKEYEKKLLKQENEYVNLKNQLENENFDDNIHCVFAMKNNVDCINPKSKEILQELNLQEKFKGVLLVNNKENMEKLFLVKPYACYGYLKKYNCYNLLEKKLYLKDNEEIKRCDSNKIIEKLFGNEGINSFPLFCEYIFECKNNADNIMKEYIIPFDFSFLKNSTTFDFLQFKNDLVGFMKDEINDVLEKII
ncbi:60S ribosomal protein L7-2, putative [Plasmodium chabaudi adami]|uniref:60S ribosomal protein L7-2, putative n=1 Tax=Plasmodium chabaudi adami TaxID=5826 RepID=A0A1D3RYZ8_PLACE|nr:60S ribosomal protein L7-2, putative [Plasmodium chabaudi adami]